MPNSEKICSCLVNKKNGTFRPTKFHLWERCLQGKALTKWRIVKADYPTNAEKTLADFTEAIKFYLERVAGVKYLGNFIIRFPYTSKKITDLSIEDTLLDATSSSAISMVLNFATIWYCRHFMRMCNKYLTIIRSSIKISMLRQMKR